MAEKETKKVNVGTIGHLGHGSYTCTRGGRAFGQSLLLALVCERIRNGGVPTDTLFIGDPAQLPPLKDEIPVASVRYDRNRDDYPRKKKKGRS